MDRRYYLAKVGLIILAIAIATVGSGMGTTKVAHSVGATARYGAAAQVEAAAWHVTATIGRFLGHIFTSGIEALD